MSTLVIGDLHGCGEEFVELLDVARRERCDARLVLVGDLFTKGPRPDLVVDLVMQHRAQGRRVDLVCGNHDIRLLEALRRRDAGHPLDSIATSELQAIRLLDRADRLVAARRLLAEAVGRGARHATLEVAADNGAAQALYGSLGFQTAGVRRRYYRNGQDALIQWRRIGREASSGER